MNHDQEIRAKALEIAVKTLSTLSLNGIVTPENPISETGEFLIRLAEIFEEYIKS